MPPTCPIRTAWSASGGLERQGKPQKRQHSSLWSSFRQSHRIPFYFQRLFRQSDLIRPEIALKISLSHFFDKREPAARALLILDGHASRINFSALEYLSRACCDVIILPAHTSHITQPFDVAIASPLKNIYKQLLLKFTRQNKERWWAT